IEGIKGVNAHCDGRHAPSRGGLCRIREGATQRAIRPERWSYSGLGNSPPEALRLVGSAQPAVPALFHSNPLKCPHPPSTLRGRHIAGAFLMVNTATPSPTGT